VVSDYASVQRMRKLHQTAANNMDAAAQAIAAGLDVELPNNIVFGKGLGQALAKHKLTEKQIDAAVRRVLYCKFKAGIFDLPAPDAAAAAKVCDSSEHRALALEAAKKTIVLLKNDNSTLPIKIGIRKIAVVGIGADADYQDNYTPFDVKFVPILDGIRRMAAGRMEVITAPKPKFTAVGAENFICEVNGKEQRGLAAKYRARYNLDEKPVLERVDSAIDFDWTAGVPEKSLEGRDFSVEWSGKLVSDKTRIVRFNVDSVGATKILLNDLYVNTTDLHRAAYNQAFYWKLEAGKEYKFVMFYVASKGHGRVKLEWLDAADENRDAVKTAGKADMAIVVPNIVEGEGMDRSDLNLPGGQDEMIRQIAAKVSTAVVLTNGAPITMSNWAAKAGAIVEAWRPGEEGGTAVAEVLFGKCNPGGKLPMTFPADVSQCPLYYNHLPSGRIYQYVERSFEPQFAFGHGLSYTTFEYSNLKLEPNNIGPAEKTMVSIDVANTGSMDGDEVVQVYIRDNAATFAHPVMQLRAFKRVSIKTGDKRTILFDIGPAQLFILDKNFRPVVEPGTFEIMVGSSSADIRKKAELTVK
jgi:beta-glucosidase